GWEDAAPSSHRLPPRGKHDEGCVRTGGKIAERHRLVLHQAAAKLDEVVVWRHGPAFEGFAQGPALQLCDRGRGLHCERHLVPDVGHHHAHRVPAPPSPPRRHGGHATSTPASSGRVEKKRSTAWSKNSVEARTPVLPVPSVPALNTTSSPP